MTIFYINYSSFNNLIPFDEEKARQKPLCSAITVIRGDFRTIGVP